LKVEILEKYQLINPNFLKPIQALTRELIIIEDMNIKDITATYCSLSENMIKIT
jgi:hypothetical protein